MNAERIDHEAGKIAVSIRGVIRRRRSRIATWCGAQEGGAGGRLKQPKSSSDNELEVPVEWLSRSGPALAKTGGIVGGGCGCRGGAIGLSSLRRGFQPTARYFWPIRPCWAVPRRAIALPDKEIQLRPRVGRRLTVRGASASLVRLFGAVAQMGERCNRTAEVRGSIPLRSMYSAPWCNWQHV